MKRIPLNGGTLVLTPYYKEYNISSDEEDLKAYTGIYVFDESTTTWKCQDNTLGLYYFKNYVLNGLYEPEPTFAFILFDSQNVAKLISISNWNEGFGNTPGTLSLNTDDMINIFTNKIAPNLGISSDGILTGISGKISGAF